MYKRVVLKLSGEALAGNTDKNFDNETIYGIIDQIKEVISQGTQVTLVVGGGDFWRGRSANPAMDRVKADQIGHACNCYECYVSCRFLQTEGR